MERITFYRSVHEKYIYRDLWRETLVETYLVHTRAMWQRARQSGTEYGNSGCGSTGSIIGTGRTHDRNSVISNCLHQNVFDYPTHSVPIHSYTKWTQKKRELLNCVVAAMYSWQHCGTGTLSYRQPRHLVTMDQWNGQQRAVTIKLCWISSIFVGPFKSSRFFVSPYTSDVMLTNVLHRVFILPDTYYSSLHSPLLLRASGCTFEWAMSVGHTGRQQQAVGILVTYNGISILRSVDRIQLHQTAILFTPK
jgi:hypothetical protein